ncbi:SusC/RagA family TonB-linked outer membrane protein [Chryseobacterium sp. OV279]|uniref:SusC/RagA family TonB-linked outer membrane protein n=1 Tax=Chryseobacterium sp. OV279 TaxID=1500285 RepID=UPI0009173E9E|nr:SusC/RagA family TonB-linked outer membrane protein [Chryseobacterium sp. OV279]SHF39275.1 TonB-linked outer membrane protein, SusC/RagA family [Chryseobacterium sp. OV279]
MKKSYISIGSIACAFMLTAASTSFQAQERRSSDTIIQRNNASEVSVLKKKADTLSPLSTSDREQVKDIEEVVLNAGYYKVKEKERTGSIAKVSAKEIENQPVSNVLSAAQGRMAGVSITQNSGVPGGGFDIQIRGRNSLRTRSNSSIDGNQPLYVIDGIAIGGSVTSPYSGTILPEASINPLNSINPGDIESLEILKDADATAIYGSRGANGVVLVTTKKAKKGKLSLSFNTSYALSEAFSNLKMMNTEQYLSVRKQAFDNDGITNYPAAAYDVNGVWDQNRNTDWGKTLIGNTAAASNTQLSLGGGSETTTFLVSLGHQEQTTVFGKDFRYKTNNISSNISHRSSDKKFMLNLSNLFSMQENNVMNQDITRNAFLLSPNAPALYDANGNLNWEKNTFNNPIAAYNSTYSNKNLQFLNNLSTEYEIFSNFRVKLNSGLNYQTFEEWSLIPHTIYNPSSGLTPTYSQAYTANSNKLSFIVEPQLNYLFKKGKHQLDVLAGGTYQSDVTNQESLQGYGFQSNAFIQNIGSAQAKVISDLVKTEYKYAAVFGRINYQFDHKYILNITGRRDGSSRFGTNNRFANFGAVGAAWLFSKEDLFKSLNLKWLSFGKLRGSYGSSGSDNIGDYQYRDTFITSSTLIYNGVVGLSPSRLFNPDFSWEKTIKLETALELGFFNNRFNLTAAWYRNRSSNQLVGYQLPAITGFTSVLANLDATVQNTGLEIELSGKPITTNDFKWDTGFNISFPKNKLISFPGLQGSTYANSYVIGEPVSIVKLYHLEGINPQTGQYQFTDYNGDGKITSPDDRQVIKNIGIEFFGGLNNSFTYKNWNLSFLIQFVKQQNRNYNYIMPSPGIMSNLPVEALNVWSAQKPDGYYMPYHSTATASHTLFQGSDASVSDASFIRLKNLQLGYRIPIENSKSIIKEAKIYFQGQNVYTWTKYFGVDPEFSSIGFLPPLRTYSLGMQISF